MPPKKGLSIEEKQAKLLNWFQSSHTMYNIKEIETIASKKTGISSMQIKDILKMLISEGLVNYEKCGISNIYWSFQYTSIMKLSNDFNKLNVKKDTLLANIEILKDELQSLKGERSKLPKKEKNKLANTVAKLKTEKSSLDFQLQQLILNSPEIINSKIVNLQKLHDNIGLLMDNIEILINFIVDSNSNGMSKHDIREYFKIPPDL